MSWLDGAIAQFEPESTRCAKIRRDGTQCPLFGSVNGLCHVHAGKQPPRAPEHVLTPEQVAAFDGWNSPGWYDKGGAIGPPPQRGRGHIGRLAEEQGVIMDAVISEISAEIAAEARARNRRPLTRLRRFWRALRGLA